MKEPKTVPPNDQPRVIGQPVDDQELVSALLRKDPRAWRELDRSLQPTLRRAIRRALERFGSVAPSDEIDELIAIIYLSLVDNDMADLRRFNSHHERGMRLASWLSFLAIPFSSHGCELSLVGGGPRSTRRDRGLFLFFGGLLAAADRLILDAADGVRDAAQAEDAEHRLADVLVNALQHVAASVAAEIDRVPTGEQIDRVPAPPALLARRRRDQPRGAAVGGDADDGERLLLPGGGAQRRRGRRHQPERRAG